MTRALGILAAALFSLSSCAKSGVNPDLDEKVDQRIQRELEKRTQLVSNNPVYLGLVSELQTGRAQLRDGKAKEAFTSFDKILQNSRYANYPEYSFAKYYLAVALYEMNVDYGALLYFVDIVQKEPLRTHTHESLRRAIQIAQHLRDDELILYLASSITPDKIPLSLREEFRYFVAKDLYQKENLDKAAELFNDVPHRSRLYLAAQYLLGTIAVKKRDLRAAAKHFQTLTDARSPVEYYEDVRLRQLGALALGRIFYEEKNYPLSIVYYKKVKRDGEFYPSALYESSWALFKLHKFNEALSVLQTLNSPFFEQVYFLKSLLMRGAIYLDLCHYPEAVETLSNLEQNFGTLKEQIDRFARQAQTPQAYYPTLSSVTRQPDGSKVYAYESLFKLAGANRDFLGVHKYIEHLQEEQATLESIKTPRADLLAKLIAQKASDLVVKASWLAGKKLLLTRQLIEDYDAVKTQIRYNVVSSERKILQSRSRGIAPPVVVDQDLIRPEFNESLKETLVWWDFNGEYWEDELGYYLFDMRSLCREPGAAKP